MIGKIINGAGFKGAVEYVLGKENSELLDSNGVRNYDEELLIKDLELIANQNERVKKPVMHLMLSFSPDDTPLLTNEKLLDISKRVIDEMGYSNSQYIIVRHKDTPHAHVHIILNRINLKLETVDNSFSKQRLNKIRISIEQDYPELTKAGEINSSQNNEHKLNGTDAVRNDIHRAIEDEIDDAENLDDLISKLDRKYEIKTELKFKRGSIDIIEGIKFSRNSIWISGSKIDKNCSYLNLLKQISNNQFNSKNGIQKIREAPAHKNINNVISIAKNVLKGNEYDNAVKKKSNWTQDNELER